MPEVTWSPSSNVEEAKRAAETASEKWTAARSTAPAAPNHRVDAASGRALRFRGVMMHRQGAAKMPGSLALRGLGGVDSVPSAGLVRGQGPAQKRSAMPAREQWRRR